MNGAYYMMVWQVWMSSSPFQIVAAGATFGTINPQKLNPGAPDKDSAAGIIFLLFALPCTSLVVSRHSPVFGIRRLTYMREER